MNKSNFSEIQISKIRNSSCEKLRSAKFDHKVPVDDHIKNLCKNQMSNRKVQPGSFFFKYFIQMKP